MSIRGRYLFLLVLIILTGVVLRLWRFYDLFYYAIDEEKGAYIIRQIVTGTHFPTVGHPTSIGVRLAPVYYYLISPLFLLFSHSPVVIGYLSVVASIAAMLLLFHITKRISTPAGLLAVFFYSISYLNSIYERRGWQLSFEGLLIIIVIYSLLELRKKKELFIFPLTGALTLMTQLEVGLFTFIPWIILFWIVFRIRVRKHFLLYAALFVFVANSGLIIFDFRHQFLNSRYLLNYFRPDASIRIQRNIPLEGTRTVYLAHQLIPTTVSRVFFPTGEANLAIQYANCPQYLAHKRQDVFPVGHLLFVSLFGYMIAMAWSKRHQTDDGSVLLRSGTWFLCIHFLAIALYTYRFHGEMAEYYLIPTFPFFFIAAGALAATALRQRMLKIPVWTLLMLFAAYNMFYLFSSHHPYGMNDKVRAVRYAISQTEGQPFTVDSFQTCWYSGGYRYLFTLLGTEPVASYMDQYLSEYYAPDNGTPPVYQVTILTPELVGPQPEGYDGFREKTLLEAEAHQSFGAIEVYVNKL